MRAPVSKKILLLFWLLGHVQAKNRYQNTANTNNVAAGVPSTSITYRKEQETQEKGTWYEGESGNATNSEAVTAPLPAEGATEGAPVGATGATSNVTAATVTAPGPGDASAEPASPPETQNVTVTAVPNVPSEPPAGTIIPSQSSASVPGLSEGAQMTTAPGGEGSEMTDAPGGDAAGEATEMPSGGDDSYENEVAEEEAEEEAEEFQEWGEGGGDEGGTKAPYVPPAGDDPFAKPPDESQWNGDEWPQESPEQMMHDKNVIIAVSTTVAFGFVVAICTAQQVIENPDGCCASICRCSVGVFCFFFKILCFPCRMCCGNKDRRSHDLIMGDNNSYTHDLELT